MSKDIIGYNVAFIGGTTYPIRDKSIEASGYKKYSTEVGVCDAPGIQRMCEGEFKSVAVAPVAEIFTCYSTNISGYAYAELVGKAPKSPSGDVRVDMKSIYYSGGPSIYGKLTYGNNPPQDMRAVNNKKDAVDIRSIAIRLPMMVAGYGYTTEGRPTPNLYDDYIKTSHSGARPSGNAEENWQKNKYARDYRERQDLWKAGPLDLRYDEQSKMWTAAPMVYQGYVLDNIPSASGRFAQNSFTSGRLNLIMGNGHNGRVQDIPHEVYIINRSVVQDIPSGTYVIAMKSHNCEIVPVYCDRVPDFSGRYKLA